MKTLYRILLRVLWPIFRYIKHEHKFELNGFFDGGLMGEVVQYKCIFCGESDVICYEDWRNGQRPGAET